MVSVDVVDRVALHVLPSSHSTVIVAQTSSSGKTLDETDSTVASEDSTSSDSSIDVEHEEEVETQLPSSSRRRSSRKSVAFSTVEVREYERVVGDQTDLVGPPLAIGWKFEESTQSSIAAYEESKPRRSQMELVITPTGRRQLLIQNSGYTSKELSEEERILVDRREKEEKANRRKKGLLHKIWKGFIRSVTALASSSGSLNTAMPPSAASSPFGAVSAFGA